MTHTQDKDHLNLLSIFHYVVGGLVALFACIPIIHLTIGLLVLFFGTRQVPADEKVPVMIISIIFIIIPLFIIFCGWVLAFLIIIAGRQLSKRQQYGFCLVMAAVECVFMPFGTILGVFTIIVLMRPSVKTLFEADTKLIESKS